MKRLTIAMAALLAFGLNADAAPTKVKRPLVVVRIQSIDNLLKQVRYVAKKAGKADEAEGILAFAENLITEKEGLEGIDTSRTWGAAVDLSANLEQPKVLIMLPIKSEKAFEQLLRFRAGVQPEKVGDAYKVESEQMPFPVFYKFAQDYIFVTAFDKANLKNLPKATEVIGVKDPGLTFDVAVNVNAIPKKNRTQLIEGFKRGVVDGMANEPAETALEKAAQKAMQTYFVEGIEDFLTQAGRARFGFRVDAKRDQFALVGSLSGKKGSELAKTIKGLDAINSVTLPALLGKKRGNTVAFLGSVETMSETFRKFFAGNFDAFLKETLKNIEDERGQAAFETLLRAIKPTIKQGVFDSGLAVLGPNAKGHYSVVGATIAEGSRVEAAVKQLVKKYPDQTAPFVKLDFAKAGDINLHKIVPPADEMAAETGRLFGDNPVVVAAFAKGRAVFAFGGDAEKQVRRVLKKTKAAPAKRFILQMSAAKIAEMVAKSAPDNPQAQEAAKVAKRLFGDKPAGKDQVRVVVTGGDRLTGRLVVKGDVIALIAKVVEAAGEDF